MHYLFVFQLKHYRKLYEAYVPMKYKSYLRKMKKLDICFHAYWFLLQNMRQCCICLLLEVKPNSFFYKISNGSRTGEWGDHLTLQAAADRVSSNSMPFFFFYVPSHFVKMLTLFVSSTIILWRHGLVDLMFNVIVPFHLDEKWIVF